MMTNNELNLKPCPFCGKTDTMVFKVSAIKIVCSFMKNGCGGSSGQADTKAEAILKWNTRSN